MRTLEPAPPHTLPHPDRPPAAQGARTIRVLLVDDHPAVCAGQARYLESDGDILVVAEAVCADSGYAAYRQHDPSAIVVMCSMRDSNALVQSAFKDGAMGFITKASNPENLAMGIRSAHRGQRCFSDDLAGRKLKQEWHDEADRMARARACRISRPWPKPACPISSSPPEAPSPPASASAGASWSEQRG